MADEMLLQWSGFDEMMAELRSFPTAMQTRVVRGAAATGASVIRKEAVRLAPMSTGPIEQGHPPPGTLKKAIYQGRLSQECTPTREVFKVGVRSGRRAQSVGKKGKNLDAFYAKWVEYGHFARVPHATSKLAKAASQALGEVKWIAARPFMRPAIAMKQADALNAMRQYVNDQLPYLTAAMVYLKAR